MSAGLESGLQELVWASSAVKAACPGGIAPMILSGETLANPGSNSPALTFQLVGGSGEYVLGSAPALGPRRVRVQFDAHAFGPQATAAQAYAARAALRSAIDGFSGAMPNSFVVDSISLIQEIDDFDSDSRSFRAMAEFYIRFTPQGS